LAPARKARPDRPNRDVENRGDLLVIHSFQSDEEDNRALLLGELGERALQVAELEPLTLLRRVDQQRFVLVQSDGAPLTGGSSDVVDILVVEYGE
jgi:hypothetical protein